MMSSLTHLFKALSDETRLRMLSLLLTQGEMCVCDFGEVLEITQSKASRHLRYLVNVGLLEDRRESMWVYFRIVDEPGSAQVRILELLSTLLPDRMPPELFRRWEKWSERKKRGLACDAHQCCPPIPEEAGEGSGFYP